MKKITLLFLSIISTYLHAHEGNFNYQKTEEQTFHYTVTNNDKLSILNQFGDIHVKIAKNNKLTIQVSISVNATNENLANDISDQIKISNTKTANQIKVETLLGRFDKKNRNLKFRIDYDITIPKDMPLHISNSFGVVEIPDFSAPLELNLSHCELMGDNISSTKSKLNLNFGVAKLGSLSGLDLNANFVKMDIEALRNVNLVDNHSQLKTNIMEDLKGSLNYTKGIVSQLKESVRLNLNYTDNFVIERLDPKIKNVEIFTHYADVELPVKNSFNGQLNVKTSFGNFFVDPNLIMYLKKHSKPLRPESKQYEYTIGTPNANNSRIIVISNHGDVKIKN